MQRDARCYLWDAMKAADAVQTFLRGKNGEAFVEDDLVRSTARLSCFASETDRI